MMNTFFQDLKFGMRMLAKHPTVTIVAVITLALGIGANTAIFSVVNAVILRPLPYRNPDRLVSLWENVPAHGRWRATPANFLDWKSQNTRFEDLAAFGASTMTLTGAGEPEQLEGARAGSGYFNVLGVEPVIGRSFVAEEYEFGKGRAVILGYGLWQRRFGGDRNVLNRTITLDGDNYLVTGVMPPGIYPSWPTTSGKISFDPNQQQYWVPLSFSAERARARNSHVIGVLGRMKPGVSIEQARAEMNAIAARLEQEYPVNKGIGIIVEPFLTEMVGNVRPALMMLVGAVGLVLLIACANIAGLLMAQHSGRSKEIAIRAALGAGRSRLMRQFVLEGFLLSVMGSVAGVLLARVGVDLILKLIPSQFPRFDQTSLDLRVLGFTLALSFGTCLLFAVVPAWHAARTNLHATLEQGGRSSNAGVKQRFRQVLVIGQVGLAMMLLIGAGLLIKTFWSLRNVDPGFEPEHVISLAISLPSSKYPGAHEINTFYNQLNGQLTNIPGVQVAAIGYDHPLQANWGDAFTIAGLPEPHAGQWPVANFNPVSPEYFHAVGTPVVIGRQFTPQDDENHPGVLIVNEAFVHKYFPNQNVLGQHLNLSQPARLLQNPKFTSFEIVGVARNVKSGGLSAESEPAYYVPATQAPIPDMTVLVRAKGDPAALVPALRSAVWAVDPNQPVAHISTMEEIVSDSIAQPRLSMILMSLFGGLALILSVVGIYGLLSYSVSQRTQEMGIRLALGAQVTDVLRLVLKQGLVLILAGEALGFIGAWALTRLIGSLLFGVTPTDPATFIAVAGTLAIVGTLGCYIPARRATKVDPLIALRYE